MYACRCVQGACRSVNGYMYECKWIHVCVYMNTCMCVYGYMYMYVCTWIHVRTCMCVHGYMYVCLHIMCMWECVIGSMDNVCVCVLGEFERTLCVLVLTFEAHCTGAVFRWRHSHPFWWRLHAYPFDVCLNTTVARLLLSYWF